jgi:hypothetical protein
MDFCEDLDQCVRVNQNVSNGCSACACVFSSEAYELHMIVHIAKLFHKLIGILAHRPNMILCSRDFGRK